MVKPHVEEKGVRGAARAAPQPGGLCGAKRPKNELEAGEEQRPAMDWQAHK